MKLQPNGVYRLIRRAPRDQSWQKPWSGVVFRSVLLEFGRPEQIVDGLGAMRSGGRWNPPGLMPALYCSFNPGTAAEESMRLFEFAGIQRACVKPRLLVGIRYSLHAVLDIAGLLNAVEGLQLTEMLVNDWRAMNARGLESPSQACGRAASNLDAEALLVPSTRVAGAQNLVVFPRNLRRKSRQAVLEEGDLGRWLK